jgi:hypothetical protein
MHMTYHGRSIPAPGRALHNRPGIRIGEVLVRQGTLTPDQVRQITDAQLTSGRPFGDLAERLFGVDPRAVEDAWVTQFCSHAPTLDPADLPLDEDCLGRINRRQAWQFQSIPIGHTDDGHLQVLTHADNLVRGLNFAARTFDEPVMMLLAKRADVETLLTEHYPVADHIKQYARRFEAV